MEYNLMNARYPRGKSLALDRPEPHDAQQLFFDKLNPHFQIETNKCVSIMSIWVIFR